VAEIWEALLENWRRMIPRHLQHCPAVVWNVPANFVRWAQHCSRICAKLISNVLCVFSDKFHVRLLYDRICGPTKWYACVCIYVCNDQNGYCIAVCTELKEQAKNDPNFITGDESSWVFGYDFETKQQSSQWQTPTSRRPKKAQDWSFFVGGAIESILHKEFVPPGQTVNCDFPRRLREIVQCTHPDKWCNNSWALRHDNALAHASLVVGQFLASVNITFMPHPHLLPGPHPLWFLHIFKNEI
jgi:hypothetical protein